MFHHFVIVNKLFIEKLDSFVTIYLFIYFILFYNDAKDTNANVVTSIAPTLTAFESCF